MDFNFIYRGLIVLDLNLSFDIIFFAWMVCLWMLLHRALGCLNICLDALVVDAFKFQILWFMLLSVDDMEQFDRFLIILVYPFYWLMILLWKESKLKFMYEGSTEKWSSWWYLCWKFNIREICSNYYSLFFAVFFSLFVRWSYHLLFLELFPIEFSLVFLLPLVLYIY